MTRVVWAKPARDDLREIRDYIAADSPRYARLIARKIVRAVGRLRTHPHSGRVVPELERPALREVIHGNYRVVYRVAPDVVTIVAVVHAARDFPSRALVPDSKSG